MEPEGWIAVRRLRTPLAPQPTDAGADARGATPDDTETSTGTRALRSIPPPNPKTGEAVI